MGNPLEDFIVKAVQKGQGIGNAVMDFFTPKQQFISPLSKDQTIPKKQQPQIQLASVAQAPQATPTPKPYRNPNIDYWRGQKGNRYDELVSGTQIASQETGIPQSLLMDIAGLESQIGMYNRVLLPKGADPATFYQTHTAAGPFMFTKGTAQEVGLEDPLSATESAKAAAKEIKKKRLSRWDVVKHKGAGGNMLLDFYTPEELSPYLQGF